MRNWAPLRAIVIQALLGTATVLMAALTIYGPKPAAVTLSDPETTASICAPPVTVAIRPTTFD